MRVSQIKGGAIISYFSIIINIISGLLYTPWILHTIGTSNYGLYTLAISLISIFVMDFGVSAAVTRYTSLYLSKGEKEKADSIVGLAYKLYVIIDVIIAVALILVFLFLGSIYKELTVEELESFRIVYVIVAVYNVIQFPFVNLNGILNAYEKFIQLKVGELINKFFVVVVTVIVLLNGGDLYSLVLINALSGLVTIIYKLYAVKRYTACKVNFRNSEVRIKEILGFSAWSTVISLASRCIFLLTPTVLGAVSGTYSIAVFGFASTLENYVFSIANALNGLFMPKISRIMISENREENLMQLMIRVGRIQIYIIGLIVVGFAAIGDLFIDHIWLGPGYEILYINTILIILPSYINLPQQIANTTMTVENKVKSQAFMFVGMALINIVLSIPLSKLFGATGACVAILVAYSFRIVVMNILYKKELGIDIVRFFKETFLRITPWHLGILAFGIVLKKALSSMNGKLVFLIVGVIIVLIYCLVSYFVNFNREEKNLVFGMIRRGKGK